jgi:hypothetical protein
MSDFLRGCCVRVRVTVRLWSPGRIFCLFAILVCGFLVGAPSAFAQTRDAGRARATRNGAVTILNLADYGAIGDGVADDSPALQQALNDLYSSGGGTLQVPPGHYALRTPVSKQFLPGTNVTISGEKSATVIDVAGNGTGLDLTSEFVVAVGADNDALALGGLDTLLVTDVAFVGVQEVASDARVVLNLNNIRQARVNNCEFYGLASLNAGGSLVAAQLTDLKLEETAFLGCAANSGLTTSLVQNISWLGISITDCKFIDYGERPGFFSKTPLQSPYSWINIGNAVNPEPNWSRREAVIKNVFLDEGSYFGISARPDLAGPDIAPFEVYLSRLSVNVNNLASDGVMIVGAMKVFIDRSHFGWSHNAGFAINLYGVGEAVLDLIDCSDDATRFQVDAQRLVVINSNHTSLDSTAPFTRVLSTNTPEEDPAQFVAQQYLKTLHTDPDPAGHFYWTDQLVRCDGDADCVAQTQSALTGFLNAMAATKFSLSGQVVDENGAPLADVTVTLTGSQSVSMPTDSQGNFAFTNLSTAGQYLVTGAKAHYTFTSVEFITPTANQITTLKGTLTRHAIAGRVFADTGAVLPGVTVTLSGTQEDSTTSDSAGDYAFTDLAGGGDYVVTAARDNYVFEVSSRTFSDLSADQYAVFEGGLLRFTVGGQVTDEEGVRLSGVRMSLTGTQTGIAITDSDGRYSFSVSAGGNYTVTPSEARHSFSPPSTSVNNLTSNQENNFTGSRTRLSIGGRVLANTGVPLGGATVTLSGTANDSNSTDDEGNYVFAELPAGGNYVVTVDRNNYVFAVPSRSFADLISDQYVAFEGVVQNYTITGKLIKDDGTVLAGTQVKLSGGAGLNTVTDAGGNYSFTVHGDDNYTVSPARLNYSFSPATRSFANLSGNGTADFSGALVDFVVSGQVVTSEGIDLDGVTISVTGSTSRIVMTNDEAGYLLNLEAEGDYTITAEKTNYSFTPQSITLNDLAANQQRTFVATLNPGVPILMAGSDPERVLAFDSVLRTVEPFKLNYNYPWVPDRRTRVMLFAKHFELPAGEGPTDVTATAEDAAHHIYPLTVEWAGKVGGSDWLIGIVVRLNDDLPEGGDVLVRITRLGLTSEPMRMGMAGTPTPP